MRRSFLGIFVLFMLATVFSGCSSTPVTYRKFTGMNEYVEKALTIKEEDHPDLNGVVVRDFEDIDITYLRGIGIETYRKVHRVMTVFRDIERYSSTSIFLTPEDKIASLSARVILPDGTIRELDEKDIYSYKNIRESGGQKRVTQRIKFNLPNFEKGSVIEYSYTVIYRGRFFSNRWDFAWHKMKVLESEAIVRIPNFFFGSDIDWNLKYKVFNYPDMPEPEIKKGLGEYGNTVYRFHVKDVPAYFPEPRMVNKDKLYPFVKVYFGSFKTPGQYGRWYYNTQIKPQLEITDKIKEKAHELTKDVETEIEKITKIKEFVESLQYNDDHVGFGHGIKPNKPEVVLRRGFGDCKDKSILLIALLKVVEIDADPVLVLTKDEGEIDPEMPYGEFNHLIVRINTKDGASIWIDPTVQNIGLGQVLWPIADTWGLVAKTQGKNYMVKLPSTDPEENGTAIKTEITVSDEMGLTYKYDIIYTGFFAHLRREIIKKSTDSEIMRDIRNILIDRFFNAEVRDLAISDSEDGSVLKMSFTVEGVKASEVENTSNHRIHLKPFSNDILPGWGFLWRKERHSPVFTGPPQHISYDVSVKLPDNHKLRSKTSSKSFSMPENELSFSQEITEEGNIFRYKEKQLINRDRISREFYGQLKEFAALHIDARIWLLTVGPVAGLTSDSGDNDDSEAGEDVNNDAGDEVEENGEGEDLEE